MNKLNTFWTKIDNKYYRIKDGILKETTTNEDASISIDNKTIVISITEDILKNINEEFGSNFNIQDFN